MTVLVPATAAALSQVRTASFRRYLMCPPEHFEVSYVINPWMDTAIAVDRDLAMRQWQQLRQTYLELGHDVEVVDAQPGLPDMVFAANGGIIIEGRALGARFAHAERQPEGPAYLQWFDAAVGRGLLTEVTRPEGTNEGEGDFLVVGDVVLGGHGFRTDTTSHDAVQELFGRPVVSLTLVDPRYYHLDTALAVLGDSTVAYYPGAFSRGSREVLRRMFPDAVLATAEDAALLGLNAVSDGRHVVLSAQATGLAAQLRQRGYVPVGVDLSELHKAGGSAKCCTLELRA